MKNKNLSFNPSEIVAVTLTMRKFLLFGKPASQLRKYFDGHWQYVSPKKYQKELADAKRAEEDAALAATVAENASKEMLRKAQNAIGRIDPNYKVKASKLRISKTEELATIDGKAQVLVVRADEAQKTLSAVELLLQE